MWSGFSSEIETGWLDTDYKERFGVACGAASRLRLKPSIRQVSEVDSHRRMWSGFSSEIETDWQEALPFSLPPSHVERLLV